MHCVIYRQWLTQLGGGPRGKWGQRAAGQWSVRLTTILYIRWSIVAMPVKSILSACYSMHTFQNKNCTKTNKNFDIILKSLK